MYSLWRYIGLRHLTEKPLRFALTILGVTLGFSLFVAIKLINESTLAGFEQNIKSVTGNAALTITAGDAGFPEKELEAIEKIVGVKAAVPLVEARAFYGTNEAVNVFGVDMLRERAVRSYGGSDGTSIDDILSFLNQPDSIVVTKSFAARHGLQIDSGLDLTTAHGRRHFVVRGMLSPSGAATAYGGNLAIMDIDGVRVMFGKVGRTDRIDVTTDGDPAALEARLRGALGSGYTVAQPQAQAETMKRMVAAFQRFLSFISTLALMIGLFMVGNTISVAVTEKRTEIGSLRALGTTRLGVLTLFLSEAYVIGALGGFFGAWLGLFAARRLGAMVAATMAQTFSTPVAAPEIHFDLGGLILATFAGSAVAVIAALRPARHAMNIAPIEAIRRDAEPMADEGAAWLTKLFAAGCVALVLLVTFVLLDRMEGLVQVLVVVAINLMAPLLAFRLFRIVRAIIVKIESAVGRLAIENLLRSPKRTTGNVLVLKVGLILFVTITVVHHSFRDSIANWLDRVLQADVVVSSYGDLASFQTQPLHEALKAKLARISPTVGAMRFSHVTVDGAKAALTAYDAPVAFDMKRGEAATLFNGDNVFLSTPLASRLHKRVGDRVEVSGHAFTVSGIINDFSSVDGVVAMDRARYKAIWNDPLVNLFYLRVPPGGNIEALRARPELRDLQVTLNRDLKAEVASAVDRSFGYLRSIEIASLAIALLALLNTLLISILERRRELGLLRAAGMSRPQLFGMILTESIVMGVIAVSLSVAMGSLLSYLWVNHTLESLLGWSVPFSFPVGAIAGAAGLGLLVCVLSAIYPAGRAAFLPITEAVANE